MRISDWNSYVFSSDLDFLYSNAGYTLLALVVEETAGMTYRDQLASEILPLPDGRSAGGFWAGEPAAPGPRAGGYLEDGPRSEGRRVGEACVSTWRYRWEPDHSIKNMRVINNKN